MASLRANVYSSVFYFYGSFLKALALLTLFLNSRTWFSGLLDLARINAGHLCLTGLLEYVWLWYEFLFSFLSVFSFPLLISSLSNLLASETKNNPVLETDVIFSTHFSEASAKVLKELIFFLTVEKLFLF